MKNKLIILLIAVVALTLVMSLTSCKNGNATVETTAEEASTTEQNTQAVTQEVETTAEEVVTTIAEESRVDAVSDTAEKTTETDTDEIDTTAEEVTTQDAGSLSGNPVTFPKGVSAATWKKIFTGPNQCTFEVVDGDETCDAMLKLTTKGGTINDPSVFFSYTNYCSKIAKCDKISADDYKYVVIKMKCEGMTSSMFELFYCSGKIIAATGDATTFTNYDNTDENWQYVLFDLSKAVNWTGKVNGLRLDFATTCKGAGEIVYISEILFLDNMNDYYKLLGYEVGEKEEYTESAEDKQKVDEILSKDDSSKNSDYYNYEKLDAEYENQDLKLGFKDMATRTAQNDNTGVGSESYLMRMAKNEIEGVNAILASGVDVKGLKVYVTDFENKNGDKLTTDLLWGYYFNVDGQSIIDPLPPVKYSEELQDGDLDWNNAGNDAGAYIPNYQKYNGFDIAAGQNQTFVIKAHTTKDTPAGQYSATFTVCDSNGQEVKKATIYVYVWDFALPEETSCKTLADISWYAIYVNHRCFNGDDGLLYQYYYDYMLENRICGYDIPYNKNAFNEEKLKSYLDNPRVTAFQTLGWKTDLNAENVSNAYNFLKENPKWLEKAYFYPIDEPNIAIDSGILDKINNYGKLLSENFPGYKLIVPMHLNSQIGDGDYFTYVSKYVNAWCPHTFFFNKFEDYLLDHRLTYRMTPKLDKTLGSFVDRMAAEQAGGDEVWWYVTRFPQDPEITLTMNTDEINYRILFWQQKLYNVDGFLYYSVTDWFDPEDWQLTTTTKFAPTQDDFPGYDGPISGDGAPTVARPIGLNSKHETNAAYPYNVYGNGVLVYVGQYFGEYGPVGCYRLECVRDGIEDFEYLTLLENAVGKETADLVIKRITTSLSEYIDDETYFMQVRNAIGNYLESINK